MHRKRILVAFGDIRGSTVFFRRAITSPEDKARVINAVYREFEKIAANKDYQVKFTGDGIMVVRELPARVAPGVVVAFLRDIENLGLAVDRTIRSHFPRPDGFRVRVACGTAFKRTIPDREPEYIDYPVSLVDRLMAVYVDKICVCHESVVGLLGKRVGPVRFEPLDPPKVHRLIGVDAEDLKGLWTFHVEKK